MKVIVLYTNKSRYTKQVMEKMARWAKTYARSIDDYNTSELADLLVIGFDNTLLKDKELDEFISSLTRDCVKNLALVNCFYKNNERMNKVIKKCQQSNLPLMREQYTFKLTFSSIKMYYKTGDINSDIVDGARLYIDDMINVIRNYY